LVRSRIVSGFPKGVSDHRDPSDRDVSGLDQNRAASHGELGCCLVDGVHQEVDLWLGPLGLQHEFAVAVGKPQPDGGLAAPDQLVAKPVPVEGKAAVELRDWDLDAVNLAKQAVGWG
jgi:hypothetical protein